MDSMKQLLESASKDLNTLNELKNLAVKTGNYELGAKCRELEKELFPETEEEINAKAKAKELKLLFEMVQLNIEPEVCFRIFSALEVFRKKKGKFDIKDAADIMNKSKSLFIR
jgi:hypothetical protein